MPSITIGDKKIGYKIIRTQRKTVSIQIRVEDGVVVRCPQSLSDKDIECLVHSKASWIAKKLQQMASVKRPQPKTFKACETMPFLGREYPFIVKPKDKRGAVVSFNGHHFTIELDGELQGMHRESCIRTAFTTWYRGQAQKTLGERLHLYAKKMHVQPRSIRVKEQKTIWGSCSSNGDLNLNWRLIMAPLEIIDYIVVHELAHLVHMNHSKAFKTLLNKMLPNVPECQVWLKEYGRTLYDW